MPPARHAALTHALMTLARLHGGDEEIRLRVGLHDGSVLDGFLVSASPEHLALRLPTAKAQYVPADQIRSVHVAQRRPFRELAAVVVLILGATAAVVGIARIAVLLPYLPRIAGGLAILGFALIVLLKRRTSLGHWLTAWRTLFDTPPP
jgi:hypothetical protein